MGDIVKLMIKLLFAFLAKVCMFLRLDSLAAWFMLRTVDLEQVKEWNDVTINIEHRDINEQHLGVVFEDKELTAQLSIEQLSLIKLPTHLYDIN